MLRWFGGVLVLATASFLVFGIRTSVFEALLYLRPLLILLCGLFEGYIVTNEKFINEKIAHAMKPPDIKR